MSNAAEPAATTRGRRLDGAWCQSLSRKGCGSWRSRKGSSRNWSAGRRPSTICRSARSPTFSSASPTHVSRDRRAGHQDVAGPALRADRDRRRRRPRRHRRTDDGSQGAGASRGERGALPDRRSARQADRRRRRPQGRAHQRHRDRQRRRTPARGRRRRRRSPACCAGSGSNRSASDLRRGSTARCRAR